MSASGRHQPGKRTMAHGGLEGDGALSPGTVIRSVTNPSTAGSSWRSMD